VFVGRASLDAASAWDQRRIQERGRRAEPDPRGILASAAASSRERPSWVEHRSTRRWLGISGESRSAGVGRSPTHGGCFQRCGFEWRTLFVGRASLDAASAWDQQRSRESGRRAEPDPRGCLQRCGFEWRTLFVGRASLDAALAWDQRRIQERGRRAEPDPRGCFQRCGFEWRTLFVGRASLDAASAWDQRRIQERGRRAEPDPRGLFSALRLRMANALRGSSNSSTLRRLGINGESRHAGVELQPDPRGTTARPPPLQRQRARMLVHPSGSPAPPEWNPP